MANVEALGGENAVLYVWLLLSFSGCLATLTGNFAFHSFGFLGFVEVPKLVVVLLMNNQKVH